MFDIEGLAEPCFGFGDLGGVVELELIAGGTGEGIAPRDNVGGTGAEVAIRRGGC